MAYIQEDSDIQTWFILESPNTKPYLPPEVWEIIFENLSPLDKRSVAAVCPEWEELILALEKKYTLLELALPLLNLDKQNILKLRTVSKGAKKAVDNILERVPEQKERFTFIQEPCFRRRSFNHAIQEIDRAFNFSFYYSPDGNTHMYGGSVTDFLTRVGENRHHEDNPFLCRHVIISLVNQNPEVYPGIVRMLTQFGHHVTALTLYDVNYGEAEEFQLFNGNHRINFPTRNLLELLNLVPNLKILNLCCLHSSNVTVEELRLEELPELKHLTSLSFGQWMNETPVPLAFLRRYGTQVIRWRGPLHFTSSIQLDELTIEAYNERLPNLRKYNLDLVDAPALSKLSTNKWKLEELSLNGFLFEEEATDIRDIINNLSQTLVLLELTDFTLIYNRPSVSWIYKMGGIFGSNGDTYKSLPKLEILSLRSVFVDTEKYCGFWEWIQKTCGHLKELYFHTLIEDETVNVQRTNQIFQKVPSLRRISHWRYTDRYQPVDVFTRN